MSASNEQDRKKSDAEGQAITNIGGATEKSKEEYVQDQSQAERDTGHGNAVGNLDGSTRLHGDLDKSAAQRGDPPASTTMAETSGKDSAKPAMKDVAQDSVMQNDTANSPITDATAKLSLEEKTHPPPDAGRKEARVRSPSPPPPPPKDGEFVGAEKEAVPKPSEPQDAGAEYDEKHSPGEDTIADQQGHGNDSRSEIQSIIDQFEEGGNGPAKDEVMSPRFDKAQPVFPPPRSSSLDPMQSGLLGSPAPLRRIGSRESYSFTPSSIRPSSISGVSISSGQQGSSNRKDSVAPPSPSGGSVFQPPPPSPDPEPSLPFDFHRFLEQLRHRTADPVARFLRSFLLEFGKKQWMVHEQVKIIADFLEFISQKMSQCEVWRTISDAEFDNAREGMEKLVMNRLYSQTFSPAIPPPASTSNARNKRKAQPDAPPGGGRKGQHQEDVERDDVISQKIRIYGWIKEEHLDMPPITEKGRKFLLLAQQELLKINSYRAPRDKVICVLNCCKVIFGFLKNNQSDQSADSFVPLLIYTILRANPEHLASNVQYILRFRNQDKLGGEAGYYISSLMGVVQFVENLDRTNLTITDEEFERNVEAAVSAIAEGHKAEEYEAKTQGSSSSTQSQAPSQLQFSEKSSLSRPEVTPRNSMEAERSTPRRSVSRLGSSEKPGANTSSGDETQEENTAVTGLLRTIQKPLSTIGRMFSDEGPSTHPVSTPQPGTTPRLTPVPATERGGSEEQQRASLERPTTERARSADSRTGAQDSAARQASAEAAEAQRIQAQEHRVVVETLQGMFPDLDKDVISDVVRMKEGRVGLAVDACLALSN